MKQLLPIHAETCPHYLHLLHSNIAIASYHIHGHNYDEEDNWASARHVCAPPLRHGDDDLQGVWGAVANGTANVISSDHAPSLYDHKLGKRKPVLKAQAQGINTAPVLKTSQTASAPLPCHNDSKCTRNVTYQSPTLRGLDDRQFRADVRPGRIQRKYRTRLRRRSVYLVPT
jgi:hypothetical protein